MASKEKMIEAYQAVRDLIEELEALGSDLSCSDSEDDLNSIIDELENQKGTICTILSNLTQDDES